MLTFRFSGADGWMVERETLTSGMVGKEVRLEFSQDWEGFSKTIVFAAGGVSRDVTARGDVAVIPHEVLAEPRLPFYVGVYGVAADGRVIPTIRVRGPEIAPGADPAGDESAAPSLPVWAQLQSAMGDLSKLETDRRDTLVDAINEAADAAGTAGLTPLQVAALDGMFKVCAYDGGKNVSRAYAVFRLAFGLSGETDAGQASNS